MLGQYNGEKKRGVVAEFERLKEPKVYENYDGGMFFKA